jgi:hypothetical protein
LFVGEDRNVRLGFGEVREIAKEAHQSSCSGINPRQGEDVSSKSHLFEDVVEEFVCLHYERRNRKRRWAKHIEKCLGTQSCLAISASEERRDAYGTSISSATLAAFLRLACTRRYPVGLVDPAGDSD